jgi:predicted Fe-Mo cluster-binding NifX family protein
MRIAIPSMDDTGMASPVAEHFGHAPFFTVVETDTGEVTAHPSPGHTGGKTPAQHLGALNVQMVLGGGMGGRAIELLSEQGMEVYLQASGTVADALKAREQGTLPQGADSEGCKDPCPPTDH